MYSTLKRQKSGSSQPASISAWCAVFDCPSIVAALTVARHGPVRRSAARRKIAARSSHGIRDQSCHASAAAAAARSTSAAAPLCTVARTWLRLCGITCSNVSPVRTSSPPITSGISSCCDSSSASFARSSSRSGDPGAYDLTGSLYGFGTRKVPWLLMRASVDGRSVPAAGRSAAGRRYGSRVARRVDYEVAGWGVGELWLEDEVVVWHELPRPRVVPAPPAASSRSDTARSAEAERDPSQTPAHPRGTGDARGEDARAGADFARRVIRAIDDYFAGDIGALDAIPVDLEYESEFHVRCARALRSVPPGQVVTYGELAALAGAPGAARAAGSFCARNRLGLFVPCHRVVGAGGLGSYGSLGLAYKRRLLALEGYADAG